MVFYVVKGAPDACGPGCDTWIAAEGKIDVAAAARLRQVRDRNLPIYFASPGGNLDQAVAMGAMLREKSAIARVARTVVRECGFEAQNGDVCLKLKQSGRVLHGDLWTRGASCNSACPYLILGATTREIAGDLSAAENHRAGDRSARGRRAALTRVQAGTTPKFHTAHRDKTGFACFSRGGESEGDDGGEGQDRGLRRVGGASIRGRGAGVARQGNRA
jgi:hypothetical protein